MDTVDRSLEALVDRDRYEIHCNGLKSSIRPFPISVDFEKLASEAQDEAVISEIERIKSKFRLNGQFIGIGIERFDYTKGIPDRFRAIDRFLEKYPQYIGQFVFIQSGINSRIHIKTYKGLNEEINQQVEQISWKYKNDSWQPIILMRESQPPLTLMALRRMADFCIVSSLHDGMNLVAKEFVTSRIDESGVLILSRFAGAAEELTDALLINPYATDQFAETIKMALDMEEEEKKRRMRKMRAMVQENNIYKWAADIISGY